MLDPGKYHQYTQDIPEPSGVQLHEGYKVGGKAMISKIPNPMNLLFLISPRFR